MPQPWIPEIDVTASLARSLIEAQWPALAPVCVEPFGGGWDNTAYLVNEQFVFRFPHRRVAAGFMDTECAVLPHIAPILPLPVPHPIFAGRPTDGYPWPFAGYRVLPGRTACVIGLDDHGRACLAKPLAHFLACLHAIPVKPTYNLGVETDMFGRLDPAQRLPMTRAALDQVHQHGLMPDIQPLVALVDDVARRHEAAPPRHAAPLLIVHGDVYASHLLIDASGDLCGIIDWGNLHAGRAAVDLMVAHLFLPPAAHASFRAAYGPIAEVDWRMARLRAVYHAAVSAVYGHEVGDEEELREGLTALHYIAHDQHSP